MSDYDPIILKDAVGIQGPPGPEGPAGPAGADGANGTGDQTHVHSQGTASSVWVIDHSLGKHPAVDLVDSAGTKIYAGVEYPSNSRVIVTFAFAVAGFAYLN